MRKEENKRIFAEQLAEKDRLEKEAFELQKQEEEKALETVEKETEKEVEIGTEVEKEVEKEVVKGEVK